MLSRGIGIFYLLMPALLQGLVVSYMTRYGNYLNEEDYPKIASGEWTDILDLKGYLYGIYCLFIGIWKLFTSYSLYLIYLNINIIGDINDRFLFLAYYIISALFGLTIIIFVIVTFVLLKNRVSHSDDSQILDKDL